MSTLAGLRSDGSFSGEPIWAIDHYHPHDLWLRGGCQPGRGTKPDASFKSLNPPVCSPDIMKAIEHTWGRFKAALYQLIYDWCVDHRDKKPDEPSPSTLRVLCETALREVTDAQTIARDVASLGDTLRIIATDVGQSFVGSKGKELWGSGGDWPDAKYR